MPPRPTVPEIFLIALRLGCTSFGGPVAHLGYFHKEYVERRRWLDDAHFADLVALCQFLPGPVSSQVGFAVGCLHRGIAGGLAAWLGFTLPSAVLMTAFAYGVVSLGELGTAGWLRGLKAAAAAVVAQAVWAMGRKLCPDLPRGAMALSAAAILVFLPSAWVQVSVIALGATVGLLFFRRFAGSNRRLPRQSPATAGEEADSPSVVPPASSPQLPPGTPWLISFFVLLLGLPLLVQAFSNPWVAVFDRFYRVGSLVFGGGHVILPLLEREVVAPGWLTHDQFLAGYGAAQALPGPLFTLSAYLGTLMAGWLRGGWAVLAIFLPSVLLVLGALPFWQTLRRRADAQAALRGANATVVGVLLAAFYHPVCTAGITDERSAALAGLAFIALQPAKIPPWAVVFATAVLGGMLL